MLPIDLYNACAGEPPPEPVNAPETVSILRTIHPTTLHRGPASKIHHVSGRDGPDLGLGRN